MPLTREDRKLLHQKAKQPTLGVGRPDNQEGYDGDIAFRKIDGSGTVEYVKNNGEWVPMSSSGSMPPRRIIGSSSSFTAGSLGFTHHDDLSGLGDDDHTQYLLIDGTRAMNSIMTIGSDADGSDRSITWGHSTLKTIMGIDDSSDAFVINTDGAFDATLANNSFSIDTNHNVIIAGGLSISGDAALNFTNAGENSIRIPDNQGSALIIEEAGNAYLTFNTANSGGEKITLSKKLEAGSIEIEGSAFDIDGGDISAATISGGLTWSAAQNLNSQNLTNVNIDSGTIDAVTLGTNSAVTEAQIDNVNINGGTINATSGDLTITAAGGDVSFGDDNIATTGNLDVDGTSNLDNTDIDGTFAVDGTTISLDATTSLNIDNSNTSNGVTIGTATSGMPISIGHTVSETTVNDNLSITGILDITNTTQSTDVSGDTGALRCEGGISIAKKGYFNSTVTIGASGGSAGADLIVHGDTNGTHMTWDESGEVLEIVGTNGNDALWVDVGDVHIDEVLDLDGSVDADVTDFDLASSGDIDLVSTNNAVGAITIHANGGTSETILIRSDQGTAATEGAASVQLLSDVGGVNIKSGLNNANAILLTADGGTSETIVLHSDQGTGAASIALVSDVGGVTVDAGLDIELNADGGNIFFKDGSQQALNIDMDDTAGDAVFKDAGNTEIFRIDGSENSVRFTGYSLTNSDPYAVSIKPLNSTQHMTMGLADKQNNYSMIGIYSAAAAAISGVSADSSYDDW